MKILRFLFVALSFAGLLHAQVEIPKDVLRMTQYEDALKQGVEQKKPLALVLLDEETVAKGYDEIVKTGS